MSLADTRLHVAVIFCLTIPSGGIIVHFLWLCASIKLKFEFCYNYRNTKIKIEYCKNKLIYFIY